jgi:hypothetical protein
VNDDRAAGDSFIERVRVSVDSDDLIVYEQ